MKKPTKKQLAALAASAAIGASIATGILTYSPPKELPIPQNQPVGWQAKYNEIHHIK